MASTAGLKLTNGARQALDKAKQLKLTLTSGYRSSAEDKRVGGTGSGYHVLGQAMDFAGSKANMDAFAKWAKGSGLFRSVLWQVADHYDHVHISWHLDGTEKGGYGNAPTGRTVQQGDTGGLVAVIQKLLGGIKVDSVFGEQTKKAVEQFQKNRGLEQDGIVGEKTWNSLTSGGGSFFS